MLEADSTGRSLPRRSWLIALLILVACEIAASWLLFANGSVLTQGSLSSGDPDGWSMSGGPVQVGKRMAFGANGVTNRGDKTIELLEAELVADDEQDGSAVILDVLADPHDQIGLAHWPDPKLATKPLHPIAGYKVRPGAHMSIVFIAKSVKPGRAEWNTMRLLYREDGTERSLESRNGWTICSKVKVVDGDSKCKTDDNAGH